MKDKARMDSLRNELLDKKRRLWTELREEVFGHLGREHAAKFDIPNDIEDLSVIDFMEDLGLAVSEMRKDELVAIEDAISRIEANEYGLCALCGGDIDEKRLALEPGAALCVRCQSTSEKGESKKPTL